MKNEDEVKYLSFYQNLVPLLRLVNAIVCKIYNQMRIKQIKSQGNIYQSHLEVKKKYSFFPDAVADPIVPLVMETVPLQTNFGVNLLNQYTFLLFHLKKSSNLKNTIGISIPQICIFVNGLPYEMLYSEGGEIKSIRGKDGIRLGQVFTFFKNKYQKRGTNKQEPSLACFESQKYQMLTDTDLFIICRKFKNDPIFGKLQYLRNKLVSTETPIESIYNSQSDYVYSGQATEGLIGSLDEAKLRESMGESHYLHYLNSKIAIYLNLENNIRLSFAHFYYSKTEDGTYYLVNVKHMAFVNLTNAIRKRERRLKDVEQQRNKILIMTQQKEKRYKSYENSNRAIEIEKVMNNQWGVLVDKLKIQQNVGRKKQEERNENAFKILFPNISIGFTDLITRKNFRKTREQIFKFDRRKSIIKTKNPVVLRDHAFSKRYVTQPSST